MNKAEEFFWKNLSKHNLTSKNVIDRQKVDFDEIIKLMQQYADEVSKNKCDSCMWSYHNKNSKGYHDVEEYYKDDKEQEEKK